VTTSRIHCITDNESSHISAEERILLLFYILSRSGKENVQGVSLKL